MVIAKEQLWWSLFNVSMVLLSLNGLISKSLFLLSQAWETAKCCSSPSVLPHLQPGGYITSPCSSKTPLSTKALEVQ